MTVSAATLVRGRVKTIADACFAAEGFVTEDDKILREAGRDGRNRMACYPELETEASGQVNRLDVFVRLQLYLAYTAEPDENIAVDPTIIEGYAARLRAAFETQSSGIVSDMWYLRLQRIEYPDDPTGNKSRFEAAIFASADNLASL